MRRKRDDGARHRIGVRLLPLVILLAVGAAKPASSATPAVTDRPVCVCLGALLAPRLAAATEKQHAYEAFARQIQDEAAAIDHDRALVDVNDEAAVGRFRARLDDLDAERKMLADVLLPDARAAIDAYSAVLARVKAECDGFVPTTAPSPNPPPASLDACGPR